MLFRTVLMLINMTGIPRLVFRLVLDGRVPLRVKLILVAALAYLAMPFDIVPDIVPVLGHIDDLLVILVSLALFLGMVPKELLSEHARGGGRRPGDGDSKPDNTVIDGQYRIVDDDKK